MIASVRQPGCVATGDVTQLAGKAACVRDGARVYCGLLVNPVDAAPTPIPTWLRKPEAAK